MTSIIRSVVTALVVLVLVMSGSAEAKEGEDALDSTGAALPNGERWLRHFREDLLPFWDVPDAWGEPRGNFPTVRCNDGKRLDPKNPCPEWAYAPPGARAHAERNWVRMQSRQAFFYGVAFHLTGDARMLALARDGVTYLRQHALEKDGSAVSWIEGDRSGPPMLERTSQDLAYAQLGMAMYYYLTRDEAVLADILRLKDHIFNRYWNAEWGMLKWVSQDPKHEQDRLQELVAQLDQMNAYLLLLAPILPEPHRSAWKADLSRLTRVVVDRFFAPEHHMFWGSLNEPDARTLGSMHTDFGHTAKALWLTERVGRLVGDEKLSRFALEEASHLVRRAYLSDGTWGFAPLAGGATASDKTWWVLAEMDQLCAMFALSDPTFARYLPTTYRFWLEAMVDHQGHEVWSMVSSDDGRPVSDVKIHLWKSGYHTGEHALVAYLATQGLKHQPAVLYFALPSREAEVRPYVLSGEVEKREASPLPEFPGRQKLRVTFGALR